MRVLALVPARGGSKGVPRKNVRMLAGKPLIGYTIEAARRAETIERVVVTTEDDEIAALSRTLGADVPFMRPAHLAQDDTPTLPVVEPAMSVLEEAGERYDAVCLLQPTSPLRPAGLVDRCVRLLEESSADSVFSVLPVPPEHNPHWVYFEREGWLRLSTGEDEPIPRRQSLPDAYHREGSVYVTRRETLAGGSLYGAHVIGVPVDPSESVNIDTEADWRRAEELVVRSAH